MTVLVRDANRDATVVALYRGGATMEEIGEVSGGISRQRIQQILHRNGVNGSGVYNQIRHDPLYVLAACRKPGIRNWHQAAIEAGLTGGSDVKEIAQRMGMTKAIGRLFRLRRRDHHQSRDAEKRTALIAQYQALCQRLGRAASFGELRPDNGVPFWTSFLEVFPGIRELRIAAGVDPKDQRGNWRRGQRKTHCKRNHILAETRNKWGHCVECERIRQRARKAASC